MIKMFSAALRANNVSNSIVTVIALVITIFKGIRKSDRTTIFLLWFIFVIVMME